MTAATAEARRAKWQEPLRLPGDLFIGTYTRIHDRIAALARIALSGEDAETREMRVRELLARIEADLAAEAALAESAP